MKTTIIPPMPAGFPPLMLVAFRPLRSETIERLKAEVAEALAAGRPLLIDGSAIAVHQLIGGEWKPLTAHEDPFRGFGRGLS